MKLLASEDNVEGSTKWMERLGGTENKKENIQIQR